MKRKFTAVPEKGIFAGSKMTNRRIMAADKTYEYGDPGYKYVEASDDSSNVDADVEVLERFISDGLDASIEDLIRDFDAEESVEEVTKSTESVAQFIEDYGLLGKPIINYLVEEGGIDPAEILMDLDVDYDEDDDYMDVMPDDIPMDYLADMLVAVAKDQGY